MKMHDKKKIPVYQVTSEYADCLEKAFAPGAAVVPGAASGGATVAPGVNKAGLKWNHQSLLRAAQRFWEKAGLEKKKIHEVRHTLGTMAGKDFSLGMVQAAMGHRSRASSEVYFHPNEEMASTVRQKIVTKLYKNPEKESQNEQSPSTIIIDGDEERGEYLCPCCSHNLLIVKEKGRKP